VEVDICTVQSLEGKGWLGSRPGEHYRARYAALFVIHVLWVLLLNFHVDKQKLMVSAPPNTIAGAIDFKFRTL